MMHLNKNISHRTYVFRFFRYATFINKNIVEQKVNRKEQYKTFFFFEKYIFLKFCKCMQKKYIQ